MQQTCALLLLSFLPAALLPTFSWLLLMMIGML
jgi:hypothetical protein